MDKSSELSSPNSYPAIFSRRAMYPALGVLLAAALFWLFRKPTGPAIDPASIVLQVQRLNQLATVKYTIQKVVGIREQKQPVGEESILLIIQANVQAGIDLASLKQEDVTRRSDGTIVVKLPPAKILNVSIDEKETRVWDRAKTWWTPWVPYSLDLEKRARQAGLEAISKGALEMGILTQAEQNAEASIRGLLQLAGIDSVLVIPAKSS